MEHTQGKVDTNLRTCLFRLVIQELGARLKKMQETPAGMAEAAKAQWITEGTLAWNYLRRGQAQSKLVQDTDHKTISPTHSP